MFLTMAGEYGPSQILRMVTAINTTTREKNTCSGPGFDLSQHLERKHENPACKLDTHISSLGNSLARFFWQKRQNFRLVLY